MWSNNDREQDGGEKGRKTLTLLLPAGKLPLTIMDKACELAKKYGLDVYLSSAQNLRLVNIQDEHLPAIQSALGALGGRFRLPGQFPVPQICPGIKQCEYGVVETESISAKILETFSGRSAMKPKLKIAIAGCTLCCSNAKLVDIGIVGTQEGYELYAGGKGGSAPKVGRRIGRGMDEIEVMEMLETLVAFHQKKTLHKQRIHKLLDDPEFPYSKV